jgi:hypothetical protein
MKHKMKLLLIAVIGTIAYFFISASCVSKVSIPIKGKLFGRLLTTTVDNKLAGLMLTNPEDEKVKHLFKSYDNRSTSNSTLSQITKTYSADVATFYFLQKEYQNIENKKAQDLYFKLSGELKQNPAPSEIEFLKDYFIVFVPGLAYKEDTATGADFSRQRRLFLKAGIQTQLIETDEWGLSENNAILISKRLRALATKYKKIIIVSASKGGLETALALGKFMKPDETCAIKAWVSVGGILRGSPIADQYLSAPKCWFAEFMLWTKGQSIEVVTDISYKRRSEDFKNLKFPENIKIIHFVAAPLATQISKEIKDRYCSMINLGPNDGLTTLTDEITENGIVVSELGLDHYFKDPDIDTKTFALACVAVKSLK